jgi:hypothetical protein
MAFRRNGDILPDRPPSAVATPAAEQVKVAQSRLLIGMPSEPSSQEDAGEEGQVVVPPSPFTLLTLSRSVFLST